MDKASKPKINRRQSRDVAFCLLFEWSFHGELFEELVENARYARELDTDDFALDLCKLAIENASELDSLIEQYSESWKVTRLSKVTLSVLRLAFCELTKFENIPLGATINEAVELCKKYATEDEAAFVNGILGQYVRREGVSQTALAEELDLLPEEEQNTLEDKSNANPGD